MSDLPQPITSNKEAHEKSGGELLFDRTVYTGIGFGVNEASSLLITDQFMHGKNLFAGIPGLQTFGQWFSEDGYNRLSDKIAGAFKMGEKIAADGSKISPRARGGNLLLMVTLLSGGTLLILPMKWLEDNKNHWVKKANHFLDGLRQEKLSAEETARRDRQVEQDIACAPRQSWPSMLLGRAIACCASVGTGTFLVGAKNNERLMDWSERMLTGSIQPKGRKNFWHRQAGLVSVETYSCATSSIVLEAMSKLFAKRNATPHEPELCQAAQADADASPQGKGCARPDTRCGTVRARQSAAASPSLASSPAI